MFHADHSFLYLIRDVDSGAILFMGRVVKPDEAVDSAHRWQLESSPGETCIGQPSPSSLPASALSLPLRAASPARPEAVEPGGLSWEALVAYPAREGSQSEEAQRQAERVVPSAPEPAEAPSELAAREVEPEALPSARTAQSEVP
jgi:hypothetical protein